MAVVRSIEWADGGGRAHPTEVDCEVRSVKVDGGDAYLQVSTFGSDYRRREKKVSQTLQFDRSAALKLAEYIERAFGSGA